MDSWIHFSINITVQDHSPTPGSSLLPLPRQSAPRSSRCCDFLHHAFVLSTRDFDGSGSTQSVLACLATSAQCNGLKSFHVVASTTSLPCHC